MLKKLFSLFMDATMFSELLQGGCAVSDTVRQQVDDACRRYPYCAPLQLLSFQANALMNEGNVADDARIRA